ncbi:MULTISPECIES: hypothetical protein [Haloarcula]|uniref:hypothetical protein n=1 Tax=Haloarcula TaxID=2237 RepID=UPI0023EB1A55|nr:hypothetical protein [Halomicroarcula sp. XH51]
MYDLQQLLRGIANPGLAVREVNRLYHTRLGRQNGNPRGIDVFEEDWDNLLILDACRYDMFEEQHSLPGTLESRISKSSHTSEFLQSNFADRDLRDTVYVTASPMYYRNRDRLNARLHDVVNVWQDFGWHEEYRTVLPETVREFAIDAAETYPDKRLVVHFLQPHYPFIGPTGRHHFDLDQLNFEWDSALTGDLGISDEVLWAAFRENLDVALPHVEALMTELRGRTVVTADHGQMIGDRSAPLPVTDYGHPPGLYTEQLVKVPWLIYENGPRREITADAAASEDADVSEEAVQDRLADLGYL